MLCKWKTRPTSHSIIEFIATTETHVVGRQKEAVRLKNPINMISWTHYAVRTAFARRQLGLCTKNDRTKWIERKWSQMNMKLSTHQRNRPMEIYLPANFSDVCRLCGFVSAQRCHYPLYPLPNWMIKNMFSIKSFVARAIARKLNEYFRSRHSRDDRVVRRRDYACVLCRICNNLILQMKRNSVIASCVRFHWINQCVEELAEAIKQK